MHSKSNKAPTKYEIERWSRFSAVGCIAARLKGHYALPEVHHLLSGGRRRGHRYTVPLSPWSHRGVPPDGMTAKEAEEKFGPSLALSPKRFRETFGDDEFLLELSDRLIEVEEYKAMGRLSEAS